MSSPHVLVTGGAGYIGSHACKALSHMGFVPVTYDNLITGHEELVKWGPLVRGDLLDQSRILATLERFRPLAVIHFAAFAYVHESVENPAKYYRNNVVGTLSLLNALSASETRNIVFSSSCAIFGNPFAAEITEDHPKAPINPYGASKLMVERILADYEKSYEIRSICLRYFNASGADPDLETGEHHEPETHLIPLILDAAAGMKSSLTINGTNFDTPDGTCVRDYVHVSDLADAHVMALKHLLSGRSSDAFNLGTGIGYSIREVIKTAEKVTGKTIPVVEGARREGDPARLVACSSRAQEILGWKPRYSSLSLQIQHAWQWRNHRAKPSSE